MKKSACLILTLILALALSLTPVSHAAVAVNGSSQSGANIAALVSEDGETILAAGAYTKIYCVRAPDLFAAYDESARGFTLIDDTGKALTSEAFESITMGGENALICSKGGLYGILSLALEPLTPFEYTWIVENGEGGFLALRTALWDDSPDGVYYIDPTGKESPTGVKLMSFILEFTDGLSPALSTDNGRYGYLSARGQWALRPQYAFADWFIGGNALATLDSGSGVIDTTGAWRITPKFDYVNLGPEGSKLIVGVNYGKRVTVFDAATCEELFTLPLDLKAAYVANGGAQICVFTEDETLVIDASGRTILSLSPEASLFTTASGQMIVYDGIWGDECARVYGEDGAPLSPAYQSLDYFSYREGEHYYLYNRFDINRTSKSANWSPDTILCGIIDARGNTILPANYVSITPASPDLILAQGRYGIYLFNYQGRQIWAMSI